MTDRTAMVPALALLFALGACDAGTDETRETARQTAAADSVPLDEHGRPLPPPGSRSTGVGCAILSEDAVEQALGFDVVMNDNATGNCLVTAADGSPAAPAIDFKVEDRTSAYDYFSAQPDAMIIPGLGDRAVWATTNEMTGNVVAVTGRRSIVVAIARADGIDATAREQAIALARAIAQPGTQAP